MRAATLLLVLLSIFGHAEDLTIQAKVQHEKESKDTSNANVVVWLTPIDKEVRAAPLQGIRLAQKNKQFIPHLLVVTVGTMVEFPNMDPYFHNVFSLYKGKRFDLGLYEAGSSRSVKFERPGVSFIFCNIHPEMSASVLVLSTPYFGVSNAAGGANLRNVPSGRYKMEVWYERSSVDALTHLSREISVPSAGIKIEVPETVSDKATHKNKYGQDYDRSKPYSE